MTTFVSSAELEELEADKRVFYSLGMVVGADDMRQDQRYMTARDDAHQRNLHGWGVASGLAVDFGGTLEVQVHPGLAVDGVGRTICVESLQCADLLAWLNSQADDIEFLGETEVWVLLCYDTCETDLLPVPSGPCRGLEDSLAPSRVVDSFRLDLSLTPPTMRDDRGHVGFAALMTDLVDEDAEEADRRAALDTFVTNRGDDDDSPFGNHCLGPDGNPCVPLAKITVEIDQDAEDNFIYAVDPDTASSVETDARPILVSSALLQEWLLRVDGGGVMEVVPDLSLMELNDTAVEGDRSPRPEDIPDNSVVKYDRISRLWQAELLDLNLLEDVEYDPGALPAPDNWYLGWNGRDTWIPKRVEATAVPNPVEGEFVRARKDRLIGIVAAGVLELEYIRPLAIGTVGNDLNNAGFGTSYGGLRVVTGGGTAAIGVVGVVFEGLFEAMDTYPELEARQFVVKATPETPFTQMSVQVLKIDRDPARGVLLGITMERMDEMVELVAEVLGSNPDPAEHNRAAVHLEFSVFDDPRVGTRHGEEVSDLWGAV